MNQSSYLPTQTSPPPQSTEASLSALAEISASHLALIEEHRELYGAFSDARSELNSIRNEADIKAQVLAGTPDENRYSASEGSLCGEPPSFFFPKGAAIRSAALIFRKAREMHAVLEKCLECVKRPLTIHEVETANKAAKENQNQASNKADADLPAIITTLRANLYVKEETTKAAIGKLNGLTEENAALKQELDNIKTKDLGLLAIRSERVRQVAKLGYTPDHDDCHTGGELILAAMACANEAGGQLEVAIDLWPFRGTFPQSNSPQRALEKAAALLAAEWDRLERQKLRENPPSP